MLVLLRFGDDSSTLVKGLRVQQILGQLLLDLRCFLFAKV